MPTAFVDLSSDGVEVLINGIKEHLVKIKTINNILREENQHLRGENNLKVEKTNSTSRVKDLETAIKKIQTELYEANRKLAENIKKRKYKGHRYQR